MKERLKRLLKRSPAIYRVAEKSYSTLSLNLRRLRLGLLGTKTLEKEWATRHLRKGNDWNNTQHTDEDDEWVMSYWDSQNHSHRPFLIEKISAFYPFSSILEIGCNCGPNLYLIAKKFVDIEARGIDINPRAIEKGNELFASDGISNVKLSVGKADELGQLQDKSFDIVFTDAVLIYIGPDKILRAVKEMIRIARRALIFVEWHDDSSQGKVRCSLGVYHLGCWKRDYTSLLKQFVAEKQIYLTKIPYTMWPGDDWGKFGYVIEVIL